METDYSVEFFTTLIECLQEACQKHLHFSQFVEVSGYLSVEIDNTKKERYFLSEILQSSGSVISESFCVKASRNSNVVQIEPGEGDPIDYHVGCEDVVLGHTRKGSAKHLSQRSTENSTRTRCYSELLANEEPADLSSSVSPRKSSRMTYGCHPPEISPNMSRISPNMSCDLDRYSSPVTQLVSTSRGPSDTVSMPVVDDHCPGTVKSKSPSLQDEVIDLDLFEEQESPTYLPLDESQDETVVEFEGQLDLEPITSLAGSLHPSPGSVVAVRNGMKRFLKFISERYNKDIELLRTPPELLNKYMLSFYRDAKKKDGTELTAISLRNLASYVNSYMKRIGYPYSLAKDEQFQPARFYIKQRLEVSEKSQSQVFSRLTEIDIEVLFQTRQLGCDCSDTLLNTMWFINTHVLKYKGPAEHFNLKWGNVFLKAEDGEEHIMRVVDGQMMTMTTVHSIPDSHRRQFVELYKRYRAVRPKASQHSDSPFYLKPARHQLESVCFISEGLSWSTFTTFWRKILLASGLPLNKRII